MNKLTKEAERQVYELLGTVETIGTSPRHHERLKGMQSIITLVRALQQAGLDPFKHAQTVELFEAVNAKYSRPIKGRPTTAMRATTPGRGRRRSRVAP